MWNGRCRQRSEAGATRARYAARRVGPAPQRRLRGANGSPFSARAASRSARALVLVERRCRFSPEASGAALPSCHSVASDRPFRVREVVARSSRKTKRPGRLRLPGLGSRRWCDRSRTIRATRPHGEGGPPGLDTATTQPLRSETSLRRDHAGYRDPVSSRASHGRCADVRGGVLWNSLRRRNPVYRRSFGLDMCADDGTDLRGQFTLDRRHAARAAPT